MPVEFLTDTQKSDYGQFAGELSPVELARYFHLDDKDRTLIDKRRGDYNRIGMALQLGTVRFLGAFLPNPIDVPDSVKMFVSQQLRITDLTSLPRYVAREATRLEHTAIIRQHYDSRDFNDPPWRFRLSRLLYARAWNSSERPSLLFDVASHWLISNKVLLPGITTLERLISQIRDRTATRLWSTLACLPRQGQKAALAKLIETSEDNRISPLEQLQQGPSTCQRPIIHCCT